MKIHVRAKCHQGKCSGSWVIHSNLDFGQLLDFDREYLCNRSSYRQAEHGVINYDLCHVRWNNLVNFGSLTNKRPWPLTLKLNRVRAVVKIRYKFVPYHQAVCSASSVIVYTRFFVLSRNGEKSVNPVLWPWPLTYDLDIIWVSFGCQGTCTCEISSNCAQQFAQGKTLGWKQYGLSLPRRQ